MQKIAIEYLIRLTRTENNMINLLTYSHIKFSGIHRQYLAWQNTYHFIPFYFPNRINPSKALSKKTLTTFTWRVFWMTLVLIWRRLSLLVASKVIRSSSGPSSDVIDRNDVSSSTTWRWQIQPQQSHSGDSSRPENIYSPIGSSVPKGVPDWLWPSYLIIKPSQA